MDIVSIQNHHIPSLVELSDHAFGIGYLSTDYFTMAVQSVSDLGYVIENGEEIIGYVLSSIVSDDNLSSFLLEGSDILSPYLAGKTIIIKQVVIKDQHQRQGWAQKLINHTLLNADKCDQFICICWKKGTDTPMEKLLVKNNFNFLKSIENYWLKDSKNKQYSCPVCGAPCRCSADIYILK